MQQSNEDLINSLSRKDREVEEHNKSQQQMSVVVCSCMLDFPIKSTFTS